MGVQEVKKNKGKEIPIDFFISFSISFQERVILLFLEKM
jgi:hypothetical protein